MAKRAIDKDVLDLMTKVSVLLGPIADGGKPAEVPRYLTDTLALFDRCRSTLGAIRLLLGHKFVHEAIALTRALFADSLALAEIAAADEAARKELVAGRELAALRDMEGVLREAESRGDDTTGEKAALVRRREHIEEFAHKENIRPRPWQPDDHLKELASKHGRGNSYLDLRITHFFVHGSSFVTRQRFALAADGETVEVGGPNVDLSWANPTGLFAADSALHAARAACAIFGWTEPSELDELLTAIEERLDEDAHPEGTE